MYILNCTCQSKKIYYNILYNHGIWTIIKIKTDFISDKKTTFLIVWIKKV